LFQAFELSAAAEARVSKISILNPGCSCFSSVPRVALMIPAPTRTTSGRDGVLISYCRAIEPFNSNSDVRLARPLSLHQPDDMENREPRGRAIRRRWSSQRKISFTRGTFTFNFSRAPSEFVTEFRNYYGANDGTRSTRQQKMGSADLQKELETLFECPKQQSAQGSHLHSRNLLARYGRALTENTPRQAIPVRTHQHQD
jgi:hypothetical protein